MKTSILSLATSTAVFGLALLLSAQEDPTSVQDGVYSKEQAQRGEKLFTEICMVCHQPNEFSQSGYMDGWSGQTVNDLVEFIRSTMPEDNPGRLKRTEYIDIVAFLFKQNGLPTGELVMQPKALRQILIEGPYESSNEP